MAPRDRTPTGYIAIGQIVGAHGIRGEVKVAVMTDFPQRYRPGARAYLGVEADCVPTEIEAVRPHKGFLLVKLAAVPDRTVAESLQGQYLLIPEDQAMPLGEHENYVHDLIGLAVETVAGEPLGTLTEILFTGANDVYVVTGPTGNEILLPALREVVLRVDLVGHKMTVAIPEGLLSPEED
ncbi:MAG: ribosome maturation factor RimM [Anaerolineae bacterium]